MQDIKYDIFLSSNYLDRNHPLVQRLLNDIQFHGYLIWRDDVHLRPGQRWAYEIGKTIPKCRYFLFILSENTSRGSIIEFQEAVHQQFKNQDYYIISIRLDKTTAPFKLIKPWDVIYKDHLQLYDLNDTMYDQTLQLILQYITKEKDKEVKIEFDIDRIQEDHSSIIQVIDRVNEDLINFFYKNPNYLKTIDRRLFEEFVAELFHGFGYDIELTKQTRDGGKDIIAIKKDIVLVKYLIECKRPDPTNKISIQVVKNLYATKVDEAATKGILATTAYFTKDAQFFFNRHKWELESCDYDGLVEWIKEYLRIRGEKYFR